MRKSSSCCRNCSCMEKVEISSSCGNDRNQKLDRMCIIRGGSSVGRVSDDSELLSTWPPRHYTCSICKRRFKSAQALGGHMNVHRRARALLRSQSISPISSPSSSTSPWHPTNISTAHCPQQNDETYVIDLTNPDFKCSSLNTPHLTRNPSFPYLPSHLPMIGITSPSTLRHVNPLSAAASGYKHAPTGSGQNHHTDHKPFNGVISAKKNNCIMVEDNNGLLSSKNTHQDDALVRLRLGNGLIISKSTDQKDIDLELHL